MTLLAGHAQTVITPDLRRPVYLAGFGQNRLAESVHDDLYAHALALEMGDTRVVLVALDLLGLGRDFCAEAQRRLREAEANVDLLIACTHTHHGPDTIGLWGPDSTQSGVDAEYMTALMDTIVRVASEALASVRPETLRVNSMKVAGVAKNARDPEIVDIELSCLQFVDAASANGGSANSESANGESANVLVTWLTFPCHPEVLWDDNPHITADYVAAMRQTVASSTGAPCLATVGALGGMMTPDMPGHTFDDAQAMGITLGEAALAALADAKAKPCRRLSYQRRSEPVSMDNPLFQVAAQAGLVSELMDSAGQVPVSAGLLTLGDCLLYAVPGELFPKLGLVYKQMMRDSGAAHAVIIGLANDELGYILPAEDFSEPRTGRSRVKPMRKACRLAWGLAPS